MGDWGPHPSLEEMGHLPGHQSLGLVVLEALDDRLHPRILERFVMPAHLDPGRGLG